MDAFLAAARTPGVVLIVDPESHTVIVKNPSLLDQGVLDELKSAKPELVELVCKHGIEYAGHYYAFALAHYGLPRE